jgi:hypothetical protein
VAGKWCPEVPVNQAPLKLEKEAAEAVLTTRLDSSLEYLRATLDGVTSIEQIDEATAARLMVHFERLADISRQIFDGLMDHFQRHQAIPHNSPLQLTPKQFESIDAIYRKIDYDLLHGSLQYDTKLSIMAPQRILIELRRVLLQLRYPPPN